MLHVSRVQTLNLPNIQEVVGVYFAYDNPNLDSLLKIAREWKAKGILHWGIYIQGATENDLREIT
jgi:hypothetical protein